MNISAPAYLQIEFLLACSAIVFVMQAGFCLLESGLVRTKNSINVAAKNLIDATLTMLMFMLFGFSVMFGTSWAGRMGMPASWDYLSDPQLLTFFIYQFLFCSTAATIVSGAVAERVKLWIYVAIAVLVSGFVYPLYGHWAWGGTLEGTAPGWLAALGFVDWAGASVVHVVGGFAGLAAAQCVGRRRHVREGSVVSGSSLTLAVLGCFLLWFGWWGFNAGSSLAIDGQTPVIILVTNLGAVTGGIVGLIWSQIEKKHVDIVYLISGILAGLVSVTGACHVLTPFGAIAAGAVGSALAIGTTHLLRGWRIDDPVSAFPVHGVAGIWGTLVFALAVPASELVDVTRFEQFLIQVTGSAVAAAFSYGSVYAFLSLSKKFLGISLRVRAGEEAVGLNVVEHGASNDVTDLLLKMNAHGKCGNYHQEIEASPHSETGRIASEYNRVLGRVREEIQGHEQTNQWLQSERLRLQSVLEHAGVGIYQLDEHGKLTSANPALLEVFGYRSSTELMDHSGATLLPWHENNEELANACRDHFDRGVRMDEREFNYLDASGKSVWVLETLTPVRDTAGRLVAWLGTVHDVTERKNRSIAEIEIANARSQAKGEFLANMSHEIRTPLNGVIGMLDLLGGADIDQKERHYVNIARSSADSLLSVINDILDFSKIESGHLELESIDFNLHEMIELTAEQFAFRAHEKGLEMNCEMSGDLPAFVVGDPERIRQVLINLLGNAIKFTESGEINLRVSTRGKVVRFSVEDTGIGLRPEAVERLFDSFTQADASTTRKYGGTGLGLTISSHLVSLMDSSIQVKSELDVGSEFWFELELPVVAQSETLDQNAVTLMGRLATSRMLVVDDNSTNCEILSSQLSNWGIEASVCQESSNVVERMLVAHRLNRSFDLVILDYFMPEMNGCDVAMEIGKHPELAGIPLILLSSSHEMLSAEQLDAHGINVALTKPARQSRLLDSIMNVLYRRAEVSQSSSSDRSTPEVQNAVAANVVKATPEPANTALQPALAPKVESYEADVLVVEDNEVNRLVVEQMLESVGYTCRSVTDGEKACSEVCQSRYRMILMDGHMPVMDGRTATREIRRLESIGATLCQNIPVVALTANVVQGAQQEFLDSGMNDYLGKPVTLEKLQAMVEKHIGKPQPRVAGPQAPLTPTRTEAIATVDSFNEPSGSIQTAAAASAPVSPKVTAQPATAALTNDGAADGRLVNCDLLVEQCGGNQQFTHQILALMRDSLPQQLSSLDDATCSYDFVKVASIAHQIKGAAGDSCLTAVYQSASDLEQHALQGRTDSTVATLGALRARVDDTIGVINQLLSEQ